MPDTDRPAIEIARKLIEMSAPGKLTEGEMPVWIGMARATLAELIRDA